MKTETESAAGGRSAAGITQDLLASVVVFLVALPLCVGIAVACGVPPERGIITGIVGGIVVGVAAGSPLLVSGPAASLIVPVYDLIQAHGILALGPVVMLAGFWQVLAGVFGLGQWFRAVAPAVITGMLVGIGVLITGSQLHVAIDGDPKSTFLENVSSLATELMSRFGSGVTLDSVAPMVVGAATVALIVGWNRLRPRRLKLVPGHFVALLVVTITVVLGGLPVRFLDLSGGFFDGLSPVTAPDFRVLLSPTTVGLSFVFAFVASAATLLTASAIDQRQTHTRTNYNREIIAQGTGNLLVGAVGGLPMTGVIVRSSVNVDAGARTRWSTVLHGVWLLAFVVAAPELLEIIPRASLGAILVYTGYKLVDVRTLRELYRRGLPEFSICLVTLLGVVFVGLFEGLVIGFGASLIRLSYTLSRFGLRSEVGPVGSGHHLHLTGSATFIRLPQLAKAIEEIPADRTLHVHVEALDYIDHACLELLSHARKSREQQGRPGMILEWNELLEKNEPGYENIPQGSTVEGDTAALLRVLWRDYKRLHHTPQPAQTDPEVTLPANWIHPSRMRLQLKANSLGGVIAEAARLLSKDAGVPEDAIRKALRAPCEGSYVTLGQGVGLPHAALAALERPLAALVTTEAPIEVEGENLDVFFVLLGPTGDPRAHLRALAQVARVCHSPLSLSVLRTSECPDRALQAFELAAAQEPPSRRGSDEVLLVVDIGGDTSADRSLEELFRRGAPSSPRIAWSGAATTATLSELLGVPRAHRMLLVSTTSRDAAVFRKLVDESGFLLPDCTFRTHLLHPAR